MPVRMFLLSLEFFVGAGSGDMGFSLKSVHDANFVGVTSHPITSVDSYFHPEEDGSPSARQLWLRSVNCSGSP